MRSFLPALGLALILHGAQQQPGSNDQAKAIQEQIRRLRSLPDDTRAATTRQLASQIRALPPAADKLSLALALSNLSTEGDFGRATLQKVATTLAETIRQLQPGSE